METKKEIKSYLRQAYVDNDQVKVVITREVTPKESAKKDENAAYILVSGMSWRSKEDGVPFIDAHETYGSIIERLLGRVIELKKTEIESAPAITGVIKFADSPNGRIAENLYKSGIARDVSVGVSVLEYDTETMAITKSKLYEVSGVTIGANEYATVIQGLDLDFNAEALIKNYVDIKPKLRQYRKLFMSDELFQMIGIEKTGDEIIDLKTIHEALKIKLANPVVENPVVEQKVENQPEYATRADFEQLINKYFIK